MNFRLYNYCAGVVSIFGGVGSFSEAVAQSQRMIALRVQATGLSESAALTSHFRERLAGQIGFFVFTVVVLGGVLFIVQRHQVPEWVACGLALFPVGAYMCAHELKKRLFVAFNI